MAQLKTKFIENNAVTNPKLADMPTLTIKGNDTGGSADPKDLTVAEVNAMLGTAAAAAAIAEDVSHLVTLSGVAVDSDNLGVFTGITIPDSSTVKASLQALETSLELKADTSVVTEIDQNVNDLITLSGVAENATTLGTFTGAIIPDSSTIKAGLQSLETYIEALPDAFFYAGTYNATTDSPALDNTDTGKNGFVYYVTVAGSQDFGAGAISFEIGDKVVNNGTTWDKWDMTDAVASVNGLTGVVVLNSSNIAENTNLYFTDERAQDAVGAMVANSTKVSLTYVDGTPSLTADIVAGSLVNADISASAAIAYSKLALTASIKAADINSEAATAGQVLTANGSGGATYASPASAPTDLEEKITLSGTDITNQYVDLAHTALGASASLNSVSLFVVGGPMQEKLVDYTVSLAGGVAGVTRITFAGDLATGGAAELIATDKLVIKYEY